MGADRTRSVNASMARKVHGLKRARLCPYNEDKGDVPQHSSGIRDAEGERNPELLLLQPRGANE